MGKILKEISTVLTIAIVITIWTVCIKIFLNPEIDYVFADLLFFVAFVMTIVTLIVWSGLIIDSGTNKSKKLNQEKQL